MAGTSTLFHARAAGLAGRINGIPLDVIAPSTLANFGGKSSSTVDQVKHETLTCGPISTSTTSSYNPATNGGQIDIEFSVTDLNLVDSNQASVVSASIHIELHVSYIPKGSRQPSIVPTGSWMALSIHGKPVKIEPLVQQFTDLDTFDKLRERHKTDATFRHWLQDACMVGRYKDLQPLGLDEYFPLCQATGQQFENRYGATVPLFRATESGPGYTAFQNAIAIEGFGRLQFGQLVITDSERYVTGLHIDLDDASSKLRKTEVKIEEFDTGGDNGVTCGSGGGGVGNTTPP